jgi:hypothetical protein
MVVEHAEGGGQSRHQDSSRDDAMAAIHWFLPVMVSVARDGDQDAAGGQNRLEGNGRRF